MVLFLMGLTTALHVWATAEAESYERGGQGSINVANLLRSAIERFGHPKYNPKPAGD